MPRCYPFPAGQGLIFVYLFAISFTSHGQDCGEGPVFTGGELQGKLPMVMDTVRPDVLGDYFADQIVADGNYAMFPVWDDDLNDYLVHIYERTADGWVLADELSNEGNEFFGYSLALKGDYAFVSDPYIDTEDGETGQIHIYRRSTDGSWPEVAVLENTYEDSFLNLEISRFGQKIAASENYLVVYANVTSRQYVHNSFGFVYRLEDGDWVFDGQLELNEDAAQFINEVTTISVDGDRIAFERDAFEENSIVVFERDASRDILPAPWYEASSFDVTLFGDEDNQNIALRGDKLFIGSGSFTSNSVPYPAVVYIYELSDNNSWELVQRLSPGNDDSAYFGDQIGLAEDFLVVGDEGANDDQGAFYLYAEDDNGTWELVDSVRTVDPLTASIYPKGYYTYAAVAITDNSIIWIKDHESADDENEEEEDVYTSTAFFYDLTPTYTLPATTLAACAAPAYRPEGTSDCEVIVTPDTMLAAAGTYEVSWTALDATGNRALATQQVTVTESTVALPLIEDFASDGPPDCWTADPAWGAFEGSYRLLPTDEQTDQNTLALPALDLDGGTTYAISFRYRALNPNGGGQLMLAMQEGSLFDDAEAPADMQYVEVLYTPTEDETALLSFMSPRDEMDEGLLLDDVSVMIFMPPTTDGAAALAGNSDNACTRVRAQGITGMGWQRILTADGKLLAEINANGNALGDVEVSMTDYDGAPTAPFTSAAQLGRYYGISPANGSGPYVTNGGVMIRLYVTDEELAQLESASGETLDWNGLIVTHYSGDNTDCDLLNSTGDYTTEDVTTAGDYGQSAHYVEVTTTSFSEFGITYREAVSVTPGWARPFTGLEAFPNPTADRVTVQLDSPVATAVRLQLTDIFGRVVQTGRYEAIAGPNRLELFLADLPSGTYLLTVTDGERAGTLRLAKRGL
jgi:hypothetical protein